MIDVPSEIVLRPYDNRHGRYWDFNEFEPLGFKFVSAFAQAFVQYSSTIALDTAQGSYSTVLSFLRWLIINQGRLIRLASALQFDHTKAAAGDWEDAVALWRDNLISKPDPGPVRKYNLIKDLNTLLKKMREFGVIPKITYMYAPLNLRAAARPIKSLAELSLQNIKEDARELLEKALSGVKGTDVEIQVKSDFLTTLIAETGDISGTAEDHARILMKINADRLAAVRNCASKDFLRWLEHWNKGQRLLQSCDMTFEEIEAAINQKSNTRYPDYYLFPHNNPDIAIPRLLKYFNDHPEYCGRMMRIGKKKVETWFHEKAKHFGGVCEMQAYLFPHQEMLTAIIIIILCDTGANVSVARTLLYDCMENSKENGYKAFKGNKARAGGKLIVNELPIKDPLHEVSCIKAVQTYQNISDTLRRLAAGKTADFLFLYVGWSGSVKGISSQQFTDMFRAFLNRHAELGGLNIQARMLRPSVLMQAVYDKETGIVGAAAIGDHISLETTSRYTNRFPTQIVWEQLIRKFQSLFQVISIQSIEGAAEKLGLTPAQVKKLLSEAHRTGLGVVCLAPTAGIQPGSEAGKTCIQLQNCPDCPNRFVVATVSNLKDLILWNQHLKQHRPEWESTRPERWGEVWLPWLVFTETAIEQASRGRTIMEFKKAKILADEQIAQGEVNLGPLW
jgi:hypothetical protein